MVLQLHFLLARSEKYNNVHDEIDVVCVLIKSRFPLKKNVL